MFAGNELIFFFLMPRLKMCVRTRGLPESWARIFATERPTVPKPMRPIFRRRSALADFFAARDLADFVFDERDDARDFPNELSSGCSSYQRPDKTRRRKPASSFFAGVRRGRLRPAQMCGNGEPFKDVVILSGATGRFSRPALAGRPVTQSKNLCSSYQPAMLSHEERSLASLGMTALECTAHV
jgi:hypothetical protein